MTPYGALTYTKVNFENGSDSIDLLKKGPACK